MFYTDLNGLERLWNKLYNVYVPGNVMNIWWSRSSTKWVQIPCKNCGNYVFAKYINNKDKAWQSEESKQAVHNIGRENVARVHGCRRPHP